MGTAVSIIIGILIFSIIIIFHELGHLIVAKKNGISVPEFSLGMGPRLCSFKIGETRYSLRLLLIGGACQMLGEDEILEDERAFNSKGPWARFAVIFAGPFFNFIMAFILSVIIISLLGYDPARVQDVEKGSPAAEAVFTATDNSGKTVTGMQYGDIISKYDGQRVSLCRELLTTFQFDEMSGKPFEVIFEREGVEYKGTITPNAIRKYEGGFTYTPSEKPCTIGQVTKGGAFDKAGVKGGDTITSVNGVEIKNGNDLNEYLSAHPFDGSELNLTLDHKGKSYETTVIPTYSERYVAPAYASNSVGLGFNHNDRDDANPLQVLKYGFVEVKYWIVTTFKSLGKLFTGQLSSDDIGGPVRVVSELENTIEESKEDGILYIVVNLMNWAILLSANLGVMNLLPLPALDGGRLVFIIIELVRGKPIDKEKEGWVHAIGIILLLILMVFIFFNDIKNVFF